jgi:hypothetical protein
MLEGQCVLVLTCNFYFCRVDQFVIPKIKKKSASPSGETWATGQETTEK